MLPTPRDLKEEFPLGEEEALFIAESRKTAQALVKGEDKRLAFITGPCSIHELDTALAYAEKLSTLAKQVEESSFLVMRVNVEKPRTALGWKGILYDPYLDGSHAIATGLRQSRKLFLELARRKIPTATEFVDPLSALYYDDLVVWGFVGARTFCSQPHRQLASSFSFPVGFKNGLDGDIDLTINSVLSAFSPHAFLYANQEGKLISKETLGNPWSHLVLRGSHFMPNYDTDSVNEACEKLTNRGLCPRLLIDCAHGNCQKEYQKQKEVFVNVLDQIRAGKNEIMGMMIESHLHEGSQSLFDELSLKYGVSITDPCLDWASTEELILSADSLISC
jgi:3-deoxy-7-phosphoheptulonate synthase